MGKKQTMENYIRPCISVPHVRGLLLLHVKEHRKKYGLQPERKCNQGGNARDKNGLMLDELVMECIQPAEQPEKGEQAAPEVKKDKRVEVQDHIFLLQAPEEVPQQEKGNVYDISAVLYT